MLRFTNSLDAAIAKMREGIKRGVVQPRALVVRMIAQAAAGGARHGKLTGVCGGLASDPLAAGLLVGLGVRELSATAAAVPSVKAALRPLDLSRCIAAATEALTLDSAAAVRAHLAAAFAAS